MAARTKRTAGFAKCQRGREWRSRRGKDRKAHFVHGGGTAGTKAEPKRLSARRAAAKKAHGFACMHRRYRRCIHAKPCAFFAAARLADSLFGSAFVPAVPPPWTKCAFLSFPRLDRHSLPLWHFAKPAVLFVLAAILKKSRRTALSDCRKSQFSARYCLELIAQRPRHICLRSGSI